MGGGEKLCGGALSSRITPVACQGPCLRGSLLPAGSPAKARNPPLASDLNMNIRNVLSFGNEATRRRGGRSALAKLLTHGGTPPAAGPPVLVPQDEPALVEAEGR